MDHVALIKQAFDDLYIEFALNRTAKGNNGELRVQKMTPMDEARMRGNIEALAWVLKITGVKIDEEVFSQEANERLSKLRN